MYVEDVAPMPSRGPNEDGSNDLKAQQMDELKDPQIAVLMDPGTISLKASQTAAIEVPRKVPEK